LIFSWLELELCLKHNLHGQGMFHLFLKLAYQPRHKQL
jgi:hypothetical protein